MRSLQTQQKNNTPRHPLHKTQKRKSHNASITNNIAHYAPRQPVNKKIQQCKHYKHNKQRQYSQATIEQNTKKKVTQYKHYKEY